MAIQLAPADFELFSRFRIPPDLMQRAGIFRVTDAEARMYGFKYSLGSNLAGLVFPYYDPVTQNRITARLRRDSPDVDANGRPVAKYLSPYGDSRRLYFAPDAHHLLADSSVSVVFVEAEKSALALAAWAIRNARRILPIATGGCYGWRGKLGTAEGPNGERVEVRGPLSDLGMLRLELRESTVLFDANAATNHLVRQARWRFSHELSALGGRVSVAELPLIQGVNGPDDLLAIAGDQPLADVLHSARLLPEHALREAARILDAWPEKFATTEEMMESRKSLLEALARIPHVEDRNALLKPAATRLKDALHSIRSAVAARVAHLEASQREWQEAVRGYTRS